MLVFQPFVWPYLTHKLMPPPKPTYQDLPQPPPSLLRERDLEEHFVDTLCWLKYLHRPDIRDRASLEANFREKFEALNRVTSTDADCPARQRPPTTRSHPAEIERSKGQFARLLDENVTPVRCTASALAA